jgi:chlorobactene glucosyltransferase
MAGHQIGLILFVVAILGIALSNLRAMRRLGDYPSAVHYPSVSVLVPARNEEENIRPCVLSLLAQDYPDFHVVVLDDESTDATWHELEELSKSDGKLRILRGQPLPEGWLGKAWACQQLAANAEGELLLFTDADTQHKPQALREAVAALQSEKADLLSALPREKAATWAEKLVLPILPWSILCFLPLALAHRLRTPSLSAACGQFMLFRREAYAAIGGHEAVRENAVDDIGLGREIKAHGRKLRLVDGGRLVDCRMYRGFGEIWEGFSKNLFAAFEYRGPLFLFVWLWLGVVFLEPPIVIALGIAGLLPATSMYLAGIAIGLSLVLWGITLWRFHFPLYLAFLYPISISLAVVIALRSLVITVNGKATWKGRRLMKHRVRWW